jgi:hypothetical protein
MQANRPYLLLTSLNVPSFLQANPRSSLRSDWLEVQVGGLPRISDVLRPELQVMYTFSAFHTNAGRKAVHSRVQSFSLNLIPNRDSAEGQNGTAYSNPTVSLENARIGLKIWAP